MYARGVLLAFALSCPLALSGVGATATLGSTAAQNPPPARVTGGTLPQRRALNDVLDSLRTHGTRVEIAPGPRAGYRGHRTTLTFIGPSDPESQWKDEIAVGVFFARGFPAAWIAIPGWGAGTLTWHGVEAIGKAGFLRTFRRAARAAHARIDRIEFLKPRALAPVVTLTAERPHAFQRRGLRLGALVDGSHPRLEGLFLIVKNAAGRVLSRGGGAIRVGAGAGTMPGSEHG